MTFRTAKLNLSNGSGINFDPNDPASATFWDRGNLHNYQVERDLLERVLFGDTSERPDHFDLCLSLPEVISFEHLDDFRTVIESDRSELSSIGRRILSYVEDLFGEIEESSLHAVEKQTLRLLPHLSNQDLKALGQIFIAYEKRFKCKKDFHIAQSLHNFCKSVNQIFAARVYGSEDSPRHGSVPIPSLEAIKHFESLLEGNLDFSVESGAEIKNLLALACSDDAEFFTEALTETFREVVELHPKYFIAKLKKELRLLRDKNVAVQRFTHAEIIRNFEEECQAVLES